MSKIRSLWLLVVVVVQVACSRSTMIVSAPDPVATMPPPKGGSVDDKSFAIVKVFYATDRNLTQSTNPSKMFGDQRSEVTFGTSEVSIPRNHREGELEAPSVLRFEFRENSENHIVLLETKVATKDQFFSEVATRTAKSQASKSFVFVHGYNVTFKDAARRTAQMAYDLGFDGAPVFYSWPSKGTLLGYPVDEDNVEWAEANLRTFLEEFLERSGSENVFLIAHSMGSRALTGALVSILEKKAHLRKKLKEVILAAPDIDAEIFKRDIAPVIIANNQKVTLYASSSDRALIASKLFNGNLRVGDSRSLTLVKGIETIDATSVSASLLGLGHSYFGNSLPVLSDIYNLMINDLSAEQRCALRGVEAKDGRYWEFIRTKPISCAASGKYPVFSDICCPN